MIRVPLAILTGFAVTFGLFFLMQQLIASGKEAITNRKAGHVVEFVRVKKEATLAKKKREIVKPKKSAEPPPETPKLDQSTSLSTDNAPIAIAPVEVQTANVKLESGLNFGIGASDGDFMPIVKVKPIYPAIALKRKTEGWVIISFTVTKTGSVKDPVVVESYPSAIFNKSALAAALKFKYRPRVINGEAIEVHGVRNKITFQLRK
jgi:protein TonB